MLSQFYLDPVIMSKENSRKPTFENKRASHHGNDPNSDFSRKGGGLSIEHIVSGNGLSKSNIDFLKNLSENILSVKDTESEFSYKKTDSYEKRNNITNNNTSSSSGVYDDCSSISSFEFVRPDDNRYSSRRKKVAPAIRNAIATHNDSYEINSKHLSTNNKKINIDTSSRESSMEKQEKTKRKSYNKNNDDDKSNNKSNVKKTVKETNLDDVGPLTNDGPCLSPRLLEPSTNVHTGSRKHDYNDRQRYEKFKRFHDNAESNEGHIESSDESNDILSPESSENGDSLQRQRSSNNPSRSKGRFADARIDKRAQRKIEESSGRKDERPSSRNFESPFKNGSSTEKLGPKSNERPASRNFESPLRNGSSIEKLEPKNKERPASRNFESPLRNGSSIERLEPKNKERPASRNFESPLINGSSIEKLESKNKERPASRNFESPLRNGSSIERLEPKNKERPASRNFESPLRNGSSIEKLEPKNSDSYDKYCYTDRKVITPTSSLDSNYNRGRDTPSSCSDSNERPRQPPTYSYHRKNKNKNSYYKEDEIENDENKNRNSYYNEDEIENEKYKNRNNNYNEDRVENNQKKNRNSYYNEDEDKNDKNNNRNSYYNDKDNEHEDIKELHSRVRNNKNQVKNENVDRNHSKKVDAQSINNKINDNNSLRSNEETDELEPIYENLHFDEQDGINSLRLNEDDKIEDELDKNEINDDMITRRETKGRLRNDSFINGRNNRHLVIQKQRPTQQQHVTQQHEQNELNYGCFTIDSSSSACSSTDSSDLDTQDEWKRLDSIFAHIDPQLLVEYLQERVKERDYTTLSSLSSLLPKEKFTGHTSHCVRCHNEYDPEHGDMECVLYHNVKDVDMISQDNECALFQCERCFTAFRLYGEFEYTQETASKCGPCFRGAHTSKSEEVEYQPEGVALTCTQKGCSVFYV